MSDILFDSISKTYKPGLFKKKVQAVDRLSFKICQGEVFGLIGPNGAGKSTTIRMLMGLIRPDSGVIEYQEKPIDSSALRQQIGYLPENPYLYDHLTLMELLNFCGQTSGLDNALISKRSQELMEKLNLLEVQSRPLRTFSKGMLQRAGICFSLLHDPDIVVLDEPMSGLDPIGRQMVFDLVMELKEQGKTIFFCSHILNDVERLCDRIGLLHKGCLIREFDRQDFQQQNGQMVFVQVQALTDEQREQIVKRGAQVRTEGDGHLVAVSGSDYFTVNRYLEDSKVSVLGCRSEWMSLEDMFMQAVKEQAQ